MKRPLAYGCLALSMSLVGCYVALSKPLTAAMPVCLLAWLRFGIGGIAMARWLKRPADEPPMSRRTRGLLFLESFLGNFLFTICMLYGVSLTTAVSAGVIMAGIPAAVALLSWLFLGERISLRVWLAVGCAALGIGLLALAKPQASLGPGTDRAWLGNLLVFGAVLCEGAYAVIGKQLTGSLSPRRITALINLWGFVLMTPFGAFIAWHFDFAALPVVNWLFLLFYGLAASMWSVWLWMSGLRSVPASQSGVFTVMLPVSAALVGVGALGETLSAMQAWAFAVALLGVILATLPNDSNAPSNPKPAGE
ncbi:DMT family transporter [Chitinimonas sp.]|uniref:DMT family transporter n=1 Tax=Chitinimonas sp. TaxID=1934313 RepID=UPI0035AF1A77